MKDDGGLRTLVVALTTAVLAALATLGGVALSNQHNGKLAELQFQGAREERMRETKIRAFTEFLAATDSLASGTWNKCHDSKPEDYNARILRLLEARTLVFLVGGEDAAAVSVEIFELLIPAANLQDGPESCERLSEVHSSLEDEMRPRAIRLFRSELGSGEG